MQLKLSIVVPIYNVEAYLKKCVDSLLNQDMSSSEYEIILVDDGSPDNCPAICDQYAAQFENVRVIHQKNAGLSAARNAGIAAAKGDYLMFVDSDDFIEPNVLGSLMAQIKRDNLDVLRYRFQYVNAVYQIFSPFSNPFRENDYSEIPTDGVTFLNTRMNTQCYAWQFIIRRDLLTNNNTHCTLHITYNTSEKDNCLFTEGIHFEDVDWTPRMLLRAQRVASTPNVVYNYVSREGSITQEGNDVEKRRRNVNDALFVIQRLNELIADYPKCTWLHRLRSDMVLAVLNTTACYLYSQRRFYVAELRRLDVFPILPPSQKRTVKNKVRLINISPRIMIDLLHWQFKIRN